MARWQPGPSAEQQRCCPVAAEQQRRLGWLHERVAAPGGHARLVVAAAADGIWIDKSRRNAIEIL